MSWQPPPPSPPPPPGPPPGPPPPPGGWVPPPSGGAWTPPPMAPAAASSPLPAGVDFATFWQRLGAYLLDGLLLSLLFVPAIVYVATGPTEIEPCQVDEDRNIIIDGDDINALCEVPTDATIGIGIGLGALGLVGMAAYWSLLEGRRGQTLGKKALGIRTLSMDDGQYIGPGRALGRFAIRVLLSSCTFGIGGLLDHLWMLWDDNNQTLHDKVARSVVVR